MAVLANTFTRRKARSLTSQSPSGSVCAGPDARARFLALPRFENIVTDQHLQERDRIGRTVALLSRLRRRLGGEAARIAADRETSLHVDPVGRLGRSSATRRPSDTLCLLPGAGGSPEVCERGKPLTTGAIAVYRLGPGGRFDLAHWQGSGGIEYELSVREASYIVARNDS